MKHFLEIRFLNFSYLFQGGYTTQKYNSENIDVIQVEAPSEVRLSKYGKRDEYTAALAQAIYNFYVAHEYDKL